MSYARVKQVLADILAADTLPAPDYDRRYGLVFQLMCEAIQLKWKYGISVDENDPAWPVFWVELPQHGEVSWHMPTDPNRAERYAAKPYQNADKFKRMTDFIAEEEIF